MSGHIFFISGPSGVGKGTLINLLRTRHPEFVFPPSCTTRDPRTGETEGETYYFISKEEFERRIAAGEFLEYARIHNGNLYGTLREKLLDGVKAGKVVIREFDVQGYLAARERLPREVFTSVFLQPDGRAEILVERMRERAPISDEEVASRLVSMQKELAVAHEYDHRVTSYDGKIEQMYEDMMTIITSATHE